MDRSAEPTRTPTAPEARPKAPDLETVTPGATSARGQSAEWNAATRAAAGPAGAAGPVSASGGALSPALRQSMERAFGADFSGVKVKTDSPEAARMGAEAFTRGEEVHFAPGKFQPDSKAGQELLGHELAHVVQQRAGRVQARVQARVEGNNAGWVDDSQGLEAEADALGARAAAGQSATLGGGASSGARASGGVVQGKFTVAAKVNAQNEPTYAPEKLKVDRILLPDQARPPTSLEKGLQGRHTIAWAAKIRLWQAQFAGPLPTVLAKLQDHLQGDAAVDRNEGSAALRSEAQGLVTGLAGGHPKVSEASHQLGQAISAYIRSYQKSSFAAFASTRPKGRAESTHLGNLADWQTQLKRNADDKVPAKDLLKVSSQNDPSATKSKKKAKVVDSALTPQSAMGAAWGLVDLNPGLEARVLHKLFGDWLELVSTLYPQLFQDGLLKRPDTKEIDTLQTRGYPQVARLRGLMMGETVEDLEDETDMAVEGETPAEEMPGLLDADIEMPSEEEEDERGKEAEEQQEEAEQNETDQAVAEAFKLPEFPVDVRMSLDTSDGPDEMAEEEKTYTAKDVEVESMAVANERLQTQFGRKQNSHTIPFSLDRLAWAKDFSGKSVEGVLKAVVERLEFEQEWGTEGPTNPTTTERAKLLEDVQASMVKTQGVSVWINELHDFIERYVAVSQRSKFATFGAEMGPRDDSDTARGHGEAAVLETFNGWEATIKGGKKAEVDGKQVTVKAQALVDVPQMGMNRKAMKVPEKEGDKDYLKIRWLHEMGIVFPEVSKAFATELGAAFDEGAKQSEGAKRLDAALSAPRASRSATKKRDVEGADLDGTGTGVSATRTATPDEIANRKKIVVKRGMRL